MLPAPTALRLGFLAAVLLGAACAPAAPPSPTAAPAKPAPTQPPAPKPTAAPAAKPAEKPAPTAAPAGPAATQPPAAKPTEQPAITPAAKPSALAPLTEAEKAEVESFYRGKNLRILVGFAPGGGYDVFARATQRHLSRHIPGSPTVVVENMTGAGSLTAANHLANAAPRDGTTIATFSPSLVLDYAMNPDPARFQFDPRKTPWLGSPTVSTNMCMVRVASGADSMEKLLASQKEIAFGSTAPSSTSTSAAPSLIRHYLGANIRVVQGFDGVASIKLAVERGEVDGTCGTWESFRASHAEWLKGNPPFARVIVKAKEDPDGDLKDVPLLGQYFKTDEARQVHAVVAAPDAAGFPYAAPPEVPPARLKALRLALMQTWEDPVFKDDARKAQLAPIPQDYATLERTLEHILGAPPERLKIAKEVLGVR